MEKIRKMFKWIRSNWLWIISFMFLIQIIHQYHYIYVIIIVMLFYLVYRESKTRKFEKIKKKSVKLKVYLLLFLFSIGIFISIINTSKNLNSNIELSAIDYSDELKPENYEPLETLDNYYDGVLTFFHDTIGLKPLELYCIEPISTHVKVSAVKSGHSKILELYDNHNPNFAQAFYYFEMNDMDRAVSDDYYIEFWLCVNNIAKYSYLNFYDNNSKKLFYFRNGANQIKIYFLSNPAENYVIETIPSNVWFHISLEIHASGDYTRYTIKYNDVYKVIENIQWNNLVMDNISYFEIRTNEVDTGYNVFLDGFNIFAYDTYNVRLIDYKTEIRNILPNKLQNYYPFTIDDLFSFYSSIIDIYPSIDNNYREYYIVDKVINDDYIDKTRLLRKKGLETTQNKYKVLQFYFDDLNNSNAFRNGLNQSLEIRIDSMDSSENLVNKYFIDLQFNKTNGLLTWNAFYRESLAVPIWKETLTNPIFRFSDYMPEGTNLISLQVNLHIFLSYVNATQKYIFIRTDIVINDYYSMSYQYDKMINAGNSVFYYTQSKLQVRYIDYFNYNNATDYLGNSWYTMNNLRGLRTLMLNSTDYKFNFLDAGFFKSELDYYVPPPPPPEPTVPDPPPDPPDPPADDLDYWDYQSFIIVEGEKTDIIVEDWTVEFQYIEVESYTARFYYRDEFFSKNDLGNWELVLNIGLGDFIISFNWIRDIVRTILNFLVLMLYILMWLLTIAFNYIIMFLGLMILLLLWNFPLYWLVVAGIWILWLLLIALDLLIQLLLVAIELIWTLLVWVWENLLIPFFEWFINDGLPLIIDFLILVVAGILALLIWLITLGETDLAEINDQIVSMLTEIADFFTETIMIFIENIPAFMLYVLMYLMLIFFCLLKLIYAKSKGYVNRVEQLDESLQAYMYPIDLTRNMIKEIKQLVSPMS